MDLLYEWATDEEVRKNSFNSSVIEYSRHKEWFQNCLGNDFLDIFILCEGTDSVGQIKLDYEADKAIISYSIGKKYRGKGYGTQVIHLIENEISLHKSEIRYLTAYVKLENIASQSVFEKNNFNFTYDRSKNAKYYTKII